MSLAHAWHAVLDRLAEHTLIERLFFSSVEFIFLAASAAVLLWMVRPRTPRLVTLVWALVLVKPLMTVSIGSPFKLWEVSAPVAIARQEIAIQEVVPVAVMESESANPPTIPDEATADSGLTDEEPTIAAVESRLPFVLPAEPLASGPAFVEQAPITLNETTPQPSFWNWSQIVWLWAAGVTVMALRALVVRRQLAKILAAGQAPSQLIANQYREIASQLNVRRSPELRITNVFESPALVGLLRPRILLPAWLMESNDEQAINWSLRHELTHWRHGDLWLVRLRELTQIAFFFHPAAWWVGRRLEEAMEIACDRAVIATDADAADYAQRLYQLLDTVRNHRRHPLAAGLFATRSQIAKRLVMLVEAPLRLHPKLTKGGIFCMTVIATAVLAFGIGVRRPESVAAADTPEALSDPPAESESTVASETTPPPFDPLAEIEAELTPKQSEPEATTTTVAETPVAADVSQADSVIQVEDIQLTEKDDQGAATFRFKVKAPIGTRFSASYQHTQVRGATGSMHVWEIVDPNGAELELKLAYGQDSKADRSISVLQSQEEMLSYHVQAKGVRGSKGLSTIVSAPLYQMPSEERLLTLFDGDVTADAHAYRNYRRVWLASPKAKAGMHPDKIRPRTEILVGLFIVIEPSTPPPKSPFTALKIKWAQQEDAIGSAHIRFRRLLQGGNSLALMEPKEVAQILADADLEKHPENFIDAATKLLADKSILEKPWGDGEFFCIGVKTRENSIWSTRVFDGEYDLVYNFANKQISVFSTGDSNFHRMALREFLSPATPNQEPNAFSTQADGKILITWRANGSHCEVVADPQSGFIFRMSVRHDRLSYSEETRQYAAQTYPGGILMPTLIVRTKYTRNESDREELSSLEMLKIHQAELNEGHEKGTFDLAAPSGTKVFIRKKNHNPTDSPRYVRLPVGVSSVAAHLRIASQVAARPTTKRLTAENAVPLTVTVVDMNGHPVPYAPMTIESHAESTHHSGATAAVNGVWRNSDGLLPTVIRARTLDGQFAGIIRPVAKQTEITLRLDPAAQVQGYLVDGAGKGMPNVRIHVGNVGDVRSPGDGVQTFGAGMTTLTDAKGKYTLAGLVPGEKYMVAIYHREGNTDYGIADVTPTEPTLIDLGATPFTPDTRELKEKPTQEVTTNSPPPNTPTPQPDPTGELGFAEAVWNEIGIRLKEIPETEFKQLNSRYRGGLRIDAVRSNSLAAGQGLRSDDVLVGLGKWETKSSQDLQFILGRPEIKDEAVKFYILRKDEALYGYLNLANSRTWTVGPFNQAEPLRFDDLLSQRKLVTRDEAIPLITTADEKPVPVKVSYSGAIGGKVLDADGKPAESVTVVFERKNKKSDDLMRLRSPWETKSKSDGSFDFGRVIEPGLLVAFNAEKTQAAALEIENQMNVTIRLRRLGTRAAVVVDSDGMPVVGCRIRYQPTRPVGEKSEYTFLKYFAFDTISKPGGVLQLSHLLPGYPLLVTGQQADRSEPFETAVSMTDKNEDIVIKLPPQAELPFIRRPSPFAAEPPSNSDAPPTPKSTSQDHMPWTKPVSTKIDYGKLLILSTDAGTALIWITGVTTEGAEQGITYRYLVEHSDGKQQHSGKGRAFERYVNGSRVQSGESRLKAGEIEVDWSQGGLYSGWIYSNPKAVKVYSIDREESAKLVAIPSGESGTVTPVQSLKSYVSSLTPPSSDPKQPPAQEPSIESSGRPKPIETPTQKSAIEGPAVPSEQKPSIAAPAIDD